MSADRLTPWERATRWPLLAAAVAFLGAYAWPILDPDLSRELVIACNVASWLVWLFFTVDYVVRLVQAEDRRRWFLHHLIDLAVVALPLLRGFQVLRVVLLVRVFGRSASATLRGKVGLYVGSGSLVLAVIAALAALDAERGAAGSTIHDFGDALWWACTTMTTVGYGDTHPVTTTGRWVGVSLMLGGVALLGTVTATLASFLVDAITEESSDETEDAVASLRDEVRTLREELRAARED